MKYLMSPEGDPLRGIQESASYLFRGLDAWAEGRFGSTPGLRFLKTASPEPGPWIKLFLPLCGINHLEADGGQLSLRPGELGVVFDNGGHGEEWEDDAEGRYLQMFFGLSPARISLNMAGRGGAFGLPAERRMYTSVSLPQHERKLLDPLLRFLHGHQPVPSHLARTLAQVLRDGARPSGLSATSRRVRRAVQLLMDNPGNPDLNVQWAADQLGCHPDYLSRRFRAETGTSFMTALRDVRMQVAADLLSDHALPVAEVAGLCGYHDHSYFSRVFRDTYGLPPSRYQKNSDHE